MNTYLIDEVFSFQVRKMSAFLVIRQVNAQSLRHRQDETAIIHVQPVAATDQLVIGVARERAIGFAAKSG